MTKIKIILLDDSQLIIDSWKLCAHEKNINFHGFTDLEPFMNFVETADKKTNIYIDSILKDGVRGEDIIIPLYHQGFSNLYITSGYEKERFVDVPFIKGIIGKAPPFIEE